MTCSTVQRHSLPLGCTSNNASPPRRLAAAMRSHLARKAARSSDPLSSRRRPRSSIVGQRRESGHRQRELTTAVALHEHFDEWTERPTSAGKITVERGKPGWQSNPCRARARAAPDAAARSSSESSRSVRDPWETAVRENRHFIVSRTTPTTIPSTTKSCSRRSTWIGVKSGFSGSNQTRWPSCR